MVSMSKFKQNFKKYVSLLTEKAGKETLVDIDRCDHIGYSRMIRFVSNYMQKNHQCEKVEPLTNLVETLDNDVLKKHYEFLSKFDWVSNNTGINRRYIIYCSLLGHGARFHFLYVNSDTLSTVTRHIIPSILDKTSMYRDIAYSKYNEKNLPLNSIMPVQPYTQEISDVCDDHGLKQVFSDIQTYLQTQGPFDFNPQVIDRKLTWILRGETFTVQGEFNNGDIDVWGMPISCRIEFNSDGGYFTLNNLFIDWDVKAQAVFKAATDFDMVKMMHLDKKGFIKGCTEYRKNGSTCLIECIHTYTLNVRTWERRSSVIDMVHILLANGANPFATNKRTGILHEACLLGDIDLIRLILSNGIHTLNSMDQCFEPENFKTGDSIENNFVNQRDSHHQTPLHIACFKLSISAHNERHLEIIQLLIEYGADVNARDMNGETPLFKSVQRGYHNPERYKNLPLATKLCEYGANVMICTNEGTSPLHMCGSSKLITLLLVLNHADVSAFDNQRQTPIYDSVRNGNMESFLIHVENGADLSNVDIEGETLLHLAVSTSIDITKFLLDNGANINAVNTRGFTPLIVATVSKELPAAMLLWERGADLEIKDQYGRSALGICESGFYNPVTQMFDKDKKIKRNVAVAMAFHDRLGEVSEMRHVVPGLHNLFFE